MGRSELWNQVKGSSFYQVRDQRLRNQLCVIEPGQMCVVRFLLCSGWRIQPLKQGQRSFGSLVRGSVVSCVVCELLNCIEGASASCRREGVHFRCFFHAFLFFSIELNKVRKLLQPGRSFIKRKSTQKTKATWSTWNTLIRVGLGAEGLTKASLQGEKNSPGNWPSLRL